MPPAETLDGCFDEIDSVSQFSTGSEVLRRLSILRQAKSFIEKYGYGAVDKMRADVEFPRHSRNWESRPLGIKVLPALT